MRVLHTSDWHVGRAIRGRSREAEHQDVLAEIVEIARVREVDAVVVAGDLFDSGSPSAQAETIVYSTLLQLADGGAQVLIIPGNHDNANRMKALRPLLHTAGIMAVPEASGVAGVIEWRAKSGELAKVAAVPWLSHAKIVRADRLMGETRDGSIGFYAAEYRRYVEHLASAFVPGAVNVLVSHVSIFDPPRGQGQGVRAVQAGPDYCVSPHVFPSSAQYVALGHYHAAQRFDAGTTAWYSGSPLQLDFGEEDESKVVLIVDVAPETLPVVEQVRLQSGKALKTLLGPVASVLEQAKHYPDAYLRLILDEAPRAGLSDEVRELIPNAVDIRVAAPERDPKRAAGVDTTGLSATDLFARYLEERGMNDDRVQKLFHDLWEEALAADTA